MLSFIIGSVRTNRLTATVLATILFSLAPIGNAEAQWANFDTELQRVNIASLRVRIVKTRETLAHISRQERLNEWALTEYNLAEALALYGLKKRAAKSLREAIDNYEIAKSQSSEPALPCFHLCDVKIGILHVSLYELEHQRNDLDLAVVAEWKAINDANGMRIDPNMTGGEAEFYLGEALQKIAESDRDGAKMDEAIKAYAEAMRRWGVISYFKPQYDIAAKKRAEAEAEKRSLP